MPILENVSNETPLSQGDILQGIRVHVTKPNWHESGGGSRYLDAEFAMVLSRPCAIAHKSSIVVASIESRAEGVPDSVESFEHVIEFLTDLRDGLSSPDRFYLGQMPGAKPGRYWARLDSLHTVSLPGPGDLSAAIGRHRIATLSDDFRADLHKRIFGAFASLGFDDHRWLSVADLKWVVSAGRQDVASIEIELLKTEADAERASASGQTPRASTKEAEKRRAKLEKLKSQLEGYEREYGKRQP
jgi:hypothetical protein